MTLFIFSKDFTVKNASHFSRQSYEGLKASISIMLNLGSVVIQKRGELGVKRHKNSFQNQSENNKQCLNIFPIFT